MSDQDLLSKLANLTQQERDDLASFLGVNAEMLQDENLQSTIAQLRD